MGFAARQTRGMAVKVETQPIQLIKLHGMLIMESIIVKSAKNSLTNVFLLEVKALSQSETSWNPAPGRTLRRKK